MKHYEINMQVSIAEKKSDYSWEMSPVVKFAITEMLPVNTDPQTYLRKRLAEEVKRQFDQFVGEFDNKTEEAKENTDPLGPF
jgi:hypothetical protein